jgi:hypothetical protein
MIMSFYLILFLYVIRNLDLSVKPWNDKEINKIRNGCIGLCLQADRLDIDSNQFKRMCSRDKAIYV